jgi:hypothetical protein
VCGGLCCVIVVIPTATQSGREPRIPWPPRVPAAGRLRGGDNNPGALILARGERAFAFLAGIVAEEAEVT